MNYIVTRIEMKPVEVVTIKRPSDYYSSSSRIILEKHLQNWRVVDFRPPADEENWIMLTGSVGGKTRNGPTNGEPRFIVVPREPVQKMEDIWE